MNFRSWLEYLLPPAVTRSWALAAGCPDEWLDRPTRPQRGPGPVQAAGVSGHEPHAPFDDVQ